MLEPHHFQPSSPGAYHRTHHYPDPLGLAAPQAEQAVATIKQRCAEGASAYRNKALRDHVIKGFERLLPASHANMGKKAAVAVLGLGSGTHLTRAFQVMPFHQLAVVMEPMLDALVQRGFTEIHLEVHDDYPPDETGVNLAKSGLEAYLKDAVPARRLELGRNHSKPASIQLQAEVKGTFYGHMVHTCAQTNAGVQIVFDMITSPEIQEGFLRVFHHAAKLNRLVLVSHNPKTANPVDETRFERAERILQASPALHFAVRDFHANVVNFWLPFDPDHHNEIHHVKDAFGIVSPPATMRHWNAYHFGAMYGISFPSPHAQLQPSGSSHIMSRSLSNALSAYRANLHALFVDPTPPEKPKLLSPEELEELWKEQTRPRFPTPPTDSKELHGDRHSKVSQEDQERHLREHPHYGLLLRFIDEGKVHSADGLVVYDTKNKQVSLEHLSNELKACASSACSDKFKEHLEQRKRLDDLYGLKSC